MRKQWICPSFPQEASFWKSAVSFRTGIVPVLLGVKHMVRSTGHEESKKYLNEQTRK